MLWYIVQMRSVLLFIVLILSLCIPTQRISETPEQIPVSGNISRGNNSRDIASYNISVRLDPELKTLTGQETITYANVTDRPIPGPGLSSLPECF